MNMIYYHRNLFIAFEEEFCLFSIDTIFNFAQHLIVSYFSFYTGCVESTETSDLDGFDCYYTL